MHRNENLAYQRSFREFANIDHWVGPHAVTLTLKQGVMPNNGGSFLMLTMDRASQNYRHFLNLLNGAVFGKGAKRGNERVNSISVIEGGNGTRLHIHAIIDCSSQALWSNFPVLIEKVWQRTQWGHGQIDVQSDADAGWTNYISKFRDKPSYVDAIDWENYHNRDCRV